MCAKEHRRERNGMIIIRMPPDRSKTALKRILASEALTICPDESSAFKGRFRASQGIPGRHNDC